MATKRRKTTSPVATKDDIPSSSQDPPPAQKHPPESAEAERTKAETETLSPLSPPREEPDLFDDDQVGVANLGTHTLADTPEVPHKDKKGVTHAFEGGYNALKSYQGQYYSGMAVGGSHVWNYDPGVWKETKEEPDLWRIDYATHKRRARNAPERSGVPVGTEYHWLIVGHQHVKKLDANVYETHLTGSKYKLAFKSADANSWSIPTVRKQREREIQLLEDAKLRVQGLPLVSEKAKVEKEDKGQAKLDVMFGRVGDKGKKRKDVE